MEIFDIYPVLPAQFEINIAFEILPPILKLPEVTALRVPISNPFSEADFSQLVQLLHINNVALILDIGEHHLSSVAAHVLNKLDGLHTSSINMVNHLRQKIDDNIQLGCFCQTRDEAMQAGEAGADYIALPYDQIDIIQWWSSVMELPIVTENISTPAEALKAKQAHADFAGVPLKLDGQDSKLLKDILSIM